MRRQAEQFHKLSHGRALLLRHREQCGAATALGSGAAASASN
jgi:hypothetical protein